MKSLLLISCVALAISARAAPPGIASLPPEASLIPTLDRDGLTARDQGDRDVCSLFAVTGLAEFENARHTPGPAPRLSEEYLIWAATKASGISGDQAMFYKAVDGLNTLGICSDASMPYMPKADPDRKPTPQALAEARDLRDRWQVHWIKRWSVDSQLTDLQLAEIKRALAAGHPVACGMRWPNNLNGYQLLDVPAASQVFDGHSIMLVGYQDDPTQKGGGILRFRNSSGPSWGENGYGTISYAYARTYANDALWLTIEPPDSEVPIRRYEAEIMTVAAHQRCPVDPQRMTDFGPRMWSGGAQLLCQAEKGGSVEFIFQVQKPGRYRLRALATAAPDFAKIRAALDGAPLPPVFDLYSGRVCPAGSLEFGTHDLPAGPHRIRFTAVAKNPASQNFYFGLDAIDLLPVRSTL